MGLPKFSTFIIALVWMSFLAVAFSLFISNITTNYGTEFDSASIDTYNKLAELNTQVKSYQNGTDIKEPSSLADRIGGYFSRGYQNMRTITNSFETFWTMTNDAFDNPNLNFPGSGSMKTAIFITVIVFLFIGVLLSAIIKREL